MRKAEKSTLQISPFYYITRYRIPLIFLVCLTIFFFIWFIISLPKPKEPDPLDPESYPYILRKKITFNNDVGIPCDINDDGISEIMCYRQ